MHGKQKSKLCIQNPIEYSSNSDICAIELVNQKKVNSCKLSWFYPKQFWKNIDYNKWIFSVLNETTANITCKTKKRTINTMGSGILKVDGDCVFKKNAITLETIGYVSQNEIQFQSSTLNFTYY